MLELLLEILSEEIPARMQARAAEDLKRLVTAGLKDAGLEFSEAKAYVTPRRLTLVVDGLPEKQPDVSEEKRGPKVDAPEQAVNGFKGSLPDGAVIEERETPKGNFFFATIDIKGAATASVLSDILSKAITALPWPKSMRWADHAERWVRPMHSMVCVFDGKIVPAVFGPVTAADESVGHRFLAPEPFSVSGFADYRQKLLAAKVMLDPADRTTKIGTDAKALAEKHGVALKDDPGLLAEVTGLVEWPVVLIGTIEDQFMELPDEVLTTSMRSHQKYFSCVNADGTLANKFIVVANTETADSGTQVVAGNERVLRARLSDAKFFWDQDRAQSLASRAPALKDRVFHAKLGTVDEKVDRMQALAGEIASHVPNADRDKVHSAARLAKADLSTGMVGEFPELQGLMGRYYALHDGEDAAVADAVAEHYSPLGPNDTCPTAPVSVCVSMADKIDSLVGFFVIDEKPTGSKDPFALRRAALGVIRLILENELRLSLSVVLEEAYYRLLYTFCGKQNLFEYGEVPIHQLIPSHPRKSEFDKQYFLLFSDSKDRSDKAEIYEGGAYEPYNVPKFARLAAGIIEFFADRLKVHLKEQGVRHDLIDSVFSLGGEDDLVRLMAKVEALQSFLGTENGGNLLAGWRRAANILRIEEKKDGVTYAEAADPALFETDQERTLATQLENVVPDVATAIADERFEDAMQALSGLRAPVDAFFDDVTVNTDDPALRVNRLKLLNGIRSALDAIADFSKIEG